MIQLTDEQKKAVGIEFVINELDIYTPYGRDKIKNLLPFENSDSGREQLSNELSNIQETVGFMGQAAHAFALGGIERALMNFREIRGSVKKLKGYGMILSEVELYELKSFLISLELLIDCMDFFYSKAKLKGIEFTEMTKALDLLDPNGNRLPGFYLSEKYSDKLKEIRNDKKDIEKKINSCDDCGALDLLKKQRLAVTVLEEEEELIVKKMLTDKLRSYAAAFSSNTESLGRLDFVMSKARLALSRRAVMPEISNDSILLEQVISPELDSLLKKNGKKMTPLTIELNYGTTVLTGANMGGKSVALKTFILNAYLFQCGFFVFAKKASLAMLDYIQLISDDMQSVYTGLSSFGAEIVKLNEIIADAKSGKALIVLDEPARGTNPYEGHKIVASLAHYLNGFKSFAIISTHYDNVASPAYSCYTVAGLDKERLGNALANPSPGLISTFMDYSLVKAPAGKAVPKDALSVCKLLSLEPGLLSLIEGEYAENN